jgi:hypothetical protein
VFHVRYEPNLCTRICYVEESRPPLWSSGLVCLFLDYPTINIAFVSVS